MKSTTIFLEEERKLTQEELAQIKDKSQNRPDGVKPEHYGEDDLVCLQISGPRALNTGTYKYISAYWKPGKKKPAFRLYSISNGIGDGKSQFFRTVEEAVESF